jgi:hypothetical protein
VSTPTWIQEIIDRRGGWAFPVTVTPQHPATHEFCAYCGNEVHVGQIVVPLPHSAESTKWTVWHRHCLLDCIGMPPISPATPGEPHVSTPTPGTEPLPFVEKRRRLRESGDLSRHIYETQIKGKRPKPTTVKVTLEDVKTWMRGGHLNDTPSDENARACVAGGLKFMNIPVELTD